MLATGDQATGDLVAQLLVPALVKLGGVMGGEHVGDARARLPQGDGRIGVDPFRTQPLHLGAPFVDLDDALGAPPP